MHGAEQFSLREKRASITQAFFYPQVSFFKPLTKLPGLRGSG